MCVAVAKAVEDGRRGHRLRVDGNTAASAAAYAARAGLTAVVLYAGRARSPRRSSAQSRAVGAKVLEVQRELRRRAARLPRARRPRHARARQLAQPAPDRGPEDGRVRDRRGARPRARRARAALRRRRQHASRTRRASPRRACSSRMISAQAASARPRSPPRSASPSRRTSTRSRRWSPTAASRSSRSTDEEITPTWLEIAQPRGHLLRAVVGRRLRRPRAASSSSRAAPSSACSPATA